MAKYLSSVGGCILASSALAQSGHWLDPGPRGGYPGFNGEVAAVVRWDPDGPGPQPELLVAGGSFSAVDRTLANKLVAWDGSRWLNLWRDHPVQGNVSDLIVYQGALVACGNFASANGKNVYYIARWDGTQWLPFGEGLSSAANCLAVYQGALYVGGSFTKAGTNSASRVARWDGSDWQPLGSGVGGTAYRMCVFNDTLIVSGSFTEAGSSTASSIAAWNGTTWSPLSQGLGSYAKGLLVHNGNLIATGAFASPAARIASWNGVAWSPLGSGLAGAGNPEGSFLTEYNGDLIVTGFFAQAGGASARNIARWDGQDWNAMGDSLGYGLCRQIGDDLISFGTKLYSWNGAQWQQTSFGFDRAIRSLALDNSELVAGGDFTSTPDGSAKYLAVRNSGTWASFGTPDSFVRRLIRTSAGLHVFGNFSAIDGVPVSGYSAIRTGSSWISLATMDGPAFDAVDFQNTLRLGGWFAKVGGVNAAGLSYRSGATWTGAGFGASTRVMLLTVFQNQLYAAGVILPTSSSPSASLLRYDGVSWHPVLNPLPVPNALCVWGDSLYVGVAQSAEAPGLNISRWDGAAWYPLGAGLNGTVNALAVHDDALYAGGAFTQSGAVPMSRVARWDGAVWHSLGSGVDSTVYTLLSDGPDLWVGGDFVRAGDFSSSRLARWRASTCTGDLNEDLMVDDADFGLFVVGYNVLDCTSLDMPPACPADLTGDGMVDDGDFLLFVAAYNQLICP